MVFGVTGTEEPKFEALKQYNDFEIRFYPKYSIAETNANEREGFRVLAKYIGVFGTPSNEAQKAMAMTAPVIMTEGDTSKNQMAFVMPFEETLSSLPIPTDERVTLKEVPSKIYAVKTFSGWYSKDIGYKQYKELVDLLHENNLNDAISKIKNNDTIDEKLIFKVAQYHPPFTLGFLRRNEIWIELSSNHAAIAALAQAKLQLETGST